MLLIEFLLTNKRMRKKNGIKPHIQQMAGACCIPLMQMSNFLAFIYHLATSFPLSFPSGPTLVLFYPVFQTHLFVLKFPVFSLSAIAPSFLRISLINSVSRSV